jgi:hypothetical protein
MLTLTEGEYVALSNAVYERLGVLPDTDSEAVALFAVWNKIRDADKENPLNDDYGVAPDKIKETAYKRLLEKKDQELEGYKAEVKRLNDALTKTYDERTLAKYQLRLLRENMQVAQEMLTLGLRRTG